MLYGFPYKAAFSPYGKQGISLLQERFTAAQPPVPAFTFAPEDPSTGEAVLFDAAGTPPPDSPIASYEWDFGDRSIGSGVLVEHAFAAAGRFVVTLKVTDVNGLSASLSKDVLVRGNLAPVASFEVSRTLMRVDVDGGA